MAATIEKPGRWYTSREAAKTVIGIDSTLSTKDARIDRAIRQMSEWLEKKTGRRFIPYTGTKEFDYQGPSQIMLGDDLLSVTTLAHDDGTETVAASDFFLYPLNAADDNKPYLAIEILFTDDVLLYDDTRQSAIQITGKWGYSEILRDSTSLLAEALDASETDIDVDAGTDFDIGQTLLVDSEQMFVTNIATNTLTVKRGMNGTTAAIHVDNSVVYIIEPPADIQMACEIMVARLIHRADAAWADSLGSGESRVSYRGTIPGEVQDVIKFYRRLVGTFQRERGFKDAVGGWYVR